MVSEFKSREREEGKRSMHRSIVEFEPDRPYEHQGSSWSMNTNYLDFVSHLEVRQFCFFEIIN